MNRRDLLKLLGGAVVATAAGVLIPEARKTYFLPPRGGWHSDWWPEGFTPELQQAYWTCVGYTNGGYTKQGIYLRPTKILMSSTDYFGPTMAHDAYGW